jgi:hypothetical protein
VKIWSSSRGRTKAEEEGEDGDEEGDEEEGDEEEAVEDEGDEEEVVEEEGDEEEAVEGGCVCCRGVRCCCCCCCFHASVTYVRSPSATPLSVMDNESNRRMHGRSTTAASSPAASFPLSLALAASGCRCCCCSVSRSKFAGFSCNEMSAFKRDISFLLLFLLRFVSSFFSAAVC